MSALKRFILWDYPRASWQYDVMVGLILAFIFLTPRAVFNDRPKPDQIVQLPVARDMNVFWVEPKMLRDIPAPERSRRVESLLRSRHNRRENVVRLEPILGDENEVTGYMVFTKP
jgi:hypothetical protein